ncbi:unnamed protein product [Chrysoparadoxa australica]
MGILLRTIEKRDLEGSRHVHEACLPVRYKQQFYNNLVEGVVQRRSNSPKESIYTQVAALTDDAGQEKALIGLITCQMVTVGSGESGDEPGDISFSDSSKYTKAAYMLTLATLPGYRNQGIGSVLLEGCVAEAGRRIDCGAVFLHVITHNRLAIQFYEKRGFVRVKELPGYYLIDGFHHNCYVYALYVNGARAPTPIDGLWQWCKSMSKRLREAVGVIWTNFQANSEATGEGAMPTQLQVARDTLV